MKIRDYFLFSILVLSSLAFQKPVLGQNLDEKYREAGSLIDKNQYAEALTLYEEILLSGKELSPFERSRIHNNMGFCFQQTGHYEQALKFYRDALEIDQEYVICLNNTASVLINQKKYEESLSFLKRAYELNKNNIKVVFNLFAAYYYLKDKDKALVYLKEAFLLDDDYAEKRLENKNVSKEDIRKLKEYIKTHRKKP